MSFLEVMRIGACFSAASLLEVSIYPSPGLVSPLDTGAHTDMNFFTFILGSSALAPYYAEFVRIGFDNLNEPLPTIFSRLRTIGVEAERELLKATSGVNTQRGQLFLLGLAAGIAGVCRAQGIEIPSPRFYDSVRIACGGLSTRELAGLSGAAQTTGERLYQKGGYLGIRGEAEAGFPTVEHIGYPAFAFAMNQGINLNDAAVHTLVAIMSKLADTTVLGRVGEEGLAVVQRAGAEILTAGSVFTVEGRELITESHQAFSATRLSPGGAADLLALSMALFFIDHGFPNRRQILTPSLFVR